MSPKVRNAETAGATGCSSRDVLAAAREEAVAAGAGAAEPARCRGRQRWS